MRKLLTITALILSSAAFSCKNWSPSSQQSSIGGEIIESDDQIASSVVAIVGDIEAPYRDYCTGTLIGPNLVLSAAHCNEKIYPKTYIIFGKEIWDDNAPKRKILKTTRHKKFSRLIWQNDIALIKFEGTTPEGFTPINLLGSGYQNFSVGNELTAYGFGLSRTGMHSNNTEPNGGILRKLALSITNFRREHHAFHTKGADNTGMCSGDSGGPVLLKRDGILFQIGLLSNGESRKCINERTEYTDIIHYRTWIEENAKELGAVTAFSKSDETQIPHPEITREDGKPKTLLDWCYASDLTEDEIDLLGTLMIEVKSWDCSVVQTHYRNTKTLDLSYSYISTAAPLSSLKSLIELDISGNSIADVCSLKKLTNLEKLNISNTRVKDTKCLDSLNLKTLIR